MDDDLLKLLEKLQQKIEYEEKEKYSTTVISECMNPINFGILKDFDALGEFKGPCGDSMKISLKIIDFKIIKALFWTDGCGATIACGNMLTKIIMGKSLQETLKISSSKILEELDGLPKEHHHCTVLAIETLHKAIDDYYIKKNLRC